MNTMMEATTAMSEYQQSAYATSYVGKYVTIADIGEDDKMVELSGMVSSVSFYDGKPMVMVNGKAYDLHKVMKVNAAPDDSAVADAAANAADSLKTATDSYLGKHVILTHVDKDGEPHSIEGYVDSVKLKAGEAYVVIGEEEYPASAISDVKDTPAFAPDDIGKAATYIGKYVTVYVPGDTPEKYSGYVERVEFKSPYAYVVFEEGGGTYPVSWITDVSASHPKAVPGAPGAESEESGPFEDDKTVDMTSEQFAARRAAFDARG
jgi:hypothetical protein